MIRKAGAEGVPPGSVRLWKRWSISLSRTGAALPAERPGQSRYGGVDSRL